MDKKVISKIKNFIIDVDGVLTDGKFYYTSRGKIAKIFGPNDGDALNIIKDVVNVHMVSGDKRGFPITKKRVADDMKFPLDMVSTFERIDWIKEKFNSEESIYMGDGIFDATVFDKVAYGIAPANAFYITKQKADFVTLSKGGDGAVAEACFHIMEKFFVPIDLLNLKLKKVGVWGGK